MCLLFVVGFGDGLKKRKTVEPVTEATPSPQPTPKPTDNAERTEAETQETGNIETIKPNKGVKAAATKKTITLAATPFAPARATSSAAERSASWGCSRTGAASFAVVPLSWVAGLGGVGGWGGSIWGCSTGCSLPEGFFFSMDASEGMEA